MQLRPGSMIGRETEFKNLSAWLKAAITVKHGVVLVRGPAGMGKTRLIDAACTNSDHPINQVLLHCEASLQKPYQVFGQWLRKRFLGPSSLKYNDPASAFSRSYRRLVESLPYRRRAEMEPGEAWLLWLSGISQPEHIQKLKPETLYDLAANALRSLLNAETELQPLALCVKNSQWLDFESTRLLVNLSNSGIIVMASLRSDLAVPASLQPLLEQADDSLDLAPLDAEETRSLVNQLCSGQSCEFSLNESVCRVIHQKTGGIPYLIEQMTLLLQDNLLNNSDKVEFDTVLPGSEVDIINGRVSRLPPNLQRCIKAASVCGLHFNADLLERVCLAAWNMEGSNTQTCLQHGTEEGFWHPGVDHEYSFNQAAGRDSIYAGLEEDERRRLNLACAEAMETSYANAADFYAHELGWHYELAGSSQAAVWYERAANLARKEFRHRQAVEYYEKALRHLDERQLDGSFELLRKKAESAQQAGLISLAKETYQRLLETSRQQLNYYEECWALSGLGHIADLQSQRDKAFELLQAALELAERTGNNDAAMISWGRLGMVLDARQDWPAAREAYQHKLLLAQTSANEAAIVSSLNNIGLVYLGEFKFTDAINILRQLAERLEKSGDPVVLSKVFGNLAYAWDEKGNLTESIQCYQRQLELAGRYGYRLGISIARCGLGAAALKKGDSAEAYSRLQEALAIGREIGIKYYTSEYLYYYGKALAAQSHFAAALEAIDQALAEAKEDEREDIIIRAGPLRWYLYTRQPGTTSAMATALTEARGKLLELAEAPGASPERSAFARLELLSVSPPDDQPHWRELCLDNFASLFSATGRDEYARILNDIKRQAD